MHSVKSEHLLRQTPGLYPDKLDLQDQDSHLYGPIGQLVKSDLYFTIKDYSRVHPPVSLLRQEGRREKKEVLQVYWLNTRFTDFFYLNPQM